MADLYTDNKIHAAVIAALRSARIGGYDSDGTETTVVPFYDEAAAVADEVLGILRGDLNG